MFAYYVIFGLLAVTVEGSQQDPGHWLLDHTHERLLFPFNAGVDGPSDVWTNGAMLVLGESEPQVEEPAPAAAAAPNVEPVPQVQAPMPPVEQPQPAPASTPAAQPAASVQQAAPVAPAGAPDLETSTWFQIGLDAMQREAGGSTKRLAKLLTNWLQHEADYETRSAIAKKVSSLEEHASFLQEGVSLLQLFPDEKIALSSPVSAAEILALQSASVFVGQSPVVSGSADKPVTKLSIPSTVEGNLVPDAAAMVVAPIGAGKWVALLPLRSGVAPSAPGSWKRVPEASAGVGTAGAVSLSLKPVMQDDSQKAAAQQPPPQAAPVQQPAPVAQQQPAPVAQPQPLPAANPQPAPAAQQQAAPAAESAAKDDDDDKDLQWAMKVMGGHGDGSAPPSEQKTQPAPVVQQQQSIQVPVAPPPQAPAQTQMIQAPAPVQAQIQTVPQAQAPIQAQIQVEPQPQVQPAPVQSAMIDTAGPDEVPPEPTPSFSAMHRSKSDWLNWKPHDDTAQVAGMLQQLGALKAQGQISKTSTPVEDSDAPRENVAPPAALANDLNKLDDDDSPPSGPSWGSVVPAQLAAQVQQQQPHVNRFLDTTPPAEPAQPAPQAVAVPQPQPQEQAPPPPMPMQAPPPQAPPSSGFLQQVAQQPSDPAPEQPSAPVAPVDLSSMIPSLKGMDPNQLKVVQSLLAKQQAGVAIPGLQRHQKRDPNDDPAVQLLSQSSNLGSMGASQVSDSSSMVSTGLSSSMASSSDMASGMASSMDGAMNSASSSMDSAMSSASSNFGGGSSYGASSYSPPSYSAPAPEIPSYSAPAPSFDMSSLGGGSFGGGSFGGSNFGGMSLMGGGSRSTNWHPPTNNQDDQAVSGLLAEVEKLTGKHVKKHRSHAQNNDAQEPAFARDFDDDDSSDSSEDSHRQKVHEMSWGALIPGSMGGGMSAIQQQPAPEAPAAPAPQAVYQPLAPAANSYLSDLTA